jgi:HSP20 family protein
MPERDLFANFERMRREMDQLFGDWPGRGLLGTQGSGFSPKTDL